MSLSDLTSPTAVKLAIEECDRLGRDVFLTRYGFGHAREYTLRFNGKEYDSKAIIGVAHGYQFPEIGPLQWADFSGGIASSGAASRAFALGFDVDGKHRPPKDWNREDCEVVVDGYFDCLREKLSGHEFNRAKVCRTLAEKIHRTRGSVDFKFQNIDAVLYKNGLPRMLDAIAPHTQKLLEYVVLDPLARHNAVFETPPDQIPKVNNIDGLIVPPPDVVPPVDADPETRSRVARKIDFAKRDANNRQLGRRGEEWVVALERKRLTELGRQDLAGRIDWVANRLGDGLGYDIVSFDESGSELLLEIKTTNAGILTPFFVSLNELAVAELNKDAYRLYRVFDFSTNPHAYILAGPLKDKLELKVQVYTAVPNASCKV